MTIHITFSDTPLERCSVRQDGRTGQFVPTIDGKDVSPTSFDEARALDIARQTLAFERRQRIIKQALIAFELGEVDTQQKQLKSNEMYVSKI